MTLCSPLTFFSPTYHEFRGGCFLVILTQNFTVKMHLGANLLIIQIPDISFNLERTLVTQKANQMEYTTLN